VPGLKERQRVALGQHRLVQADAAEIMGVFAEAGTETEKEGDRCTDGKEWAGWREPAGGLRIEARSI
jgi:hypothetical protein